MTATEIIDYLNQKKLKNVDIQGIGYKMTGIEQDDLDKYISYIQRIGRLY